MTIGKASAALAVVVAAGLCLHACAWDFVSDDAFINLRYSQNLLAGHGLVFNVGERVEAYSSLSWVLLTALLGAVGIDLLQGARWLGLLCAVASALLAMRIIARLSETLPLARGAAGALIAASAPFACWALGGMDAPLFSLVVLVAVFATLRFAHGGAPWLAGLTAGACAVTRPEGLLVGAAMLLVGAVGVERGTRRRALPAFVTFGGLVAALFAFRLAYYGEWLPNTYYAKIGAPSVLLAMRGVDYLADFGRDHGGAVLLLAPFLAAFWRRDAAFWVTAAAALSMLVAVVLEGGDGLPMYRFLVPIVPVWSILAASLLSDGAARLRRGPRSAPWILALGATCACLAWPAAESLHYLRYRGHKDFEVEAWSAAGKWLRGNAPPGASVACVPIGAVSYYSGLPVIDMLGLTDKHIARAPLATGDGWAGHEKRDGQYVLSRQPTFLLLGNVRVLDRALSIDDPEFVRIAHPAIEAREGDVYGQELVRNYQPRVANLGGGLFLHFLQRR